ncbi:hypothetical protein T4C_9349 [Trichinella pseudospiralis]|uniref:Uncharacterized protein n=1 Tax=Trichinella pseudospiralis TaxID=6337 RepID=A0A0V1JV80_TRIPS|nr:hypothetical protein T4C_9349 [Trichinella pseudospiralis]
MVRSKRYILHSTTAELNPLHMAECTSKYKKKFCMLFYNTENKVNSTVIAQFSYCHTKYLSYCLYCSL